MDVFAAFATFDQNNSLNLIRHVRLYVRCSQKNLLFKVIKIQWFFPDNFKTNLKLLFYTTSGKSYFVLINKLIFQSS